MTSVARGGTSTTIGFDLVDRVATLTHAFATTTANIAYTFGYTPASQAATSNTAYDWAGTSAATTNTTADGLNRDATIAAVGAPCAASGAGYDCNGNLTFDGVRTFSYDGENRLLTESGPVSLSLSYDPLGRLQQEVVNGATTQFLYDGGALVAEYDGSGNLLRRYVHGPSADNPLIWFEGASVAAANASFLIADRQGSIIATANSAGAQTSLYAYDPYGGPSAWGGSRFRYTGQIEIPEAQLYYYKARVYDPASGRFLQTDPVGYGADLDLYVYVHDDPNDASDPTGLADCTGSNIGCGGGIAPGSSGSSTLGAGHSLPTSADRTSTTGGGTSNQPSSGNQSSGNSNSGPVELAQNTRAAPRDVDQIPRNPSAPAPDGQARDMLMCMEGRCPGAISKITSTSEAIPQHPPTDPHRTNQAVDFHAADARSAMMCAAQCGGVYQRIEGTSRRTGAHQSTGPHIHVQTRPGLNNTTGPYYPEVP